MPTILLGFAPGRLTEAQLARVRELAPSMDLVLTDDRHEMERVLDDVEIMVGHIPHDLPPRAPRLRWLQQWSAGADWLMRYPDAAKHPFVLTNASGVHAIPIAEHIIMFVLALARDLASALRAQERGEWTRPGRESVVEVAGKTMVLVGVGAIGERTARLAACLGMRVLGVRRNPAVDAAGVEQMFGSEQLDQLLPQADFLVLTVPLTPDTRALIGERELRLIKPSAFVINIGRGGTIDEDALVKALREGWIAGAGLDVFHSEPLPGESPLWGLPNVLITAHYSGASPAYYERAFALFIDNLQRYLAGAPLQNVVDKALCY